MTTLNLLAYSEAQAQEIIHLLLKEKLVLEVNLIENSTCYKLDDTNNITEQPSLTLVCTTKSLLFPKIDALLRKKYPDNMPVLYSVPIIHMDWEQSEKLVGGTQSV